MAIEPPRLPCRRPRARRAPAPTAAEQSEDAADRGKDREDRDPRGSHARCRLHEPLPCRRPLAVGARGALYAAVNLKNNGFFSVEPVARPGAPDWFDMADPRPVDSRLGASASVVVIGGRRDEEHPAHPAHGLAYRRFRSREICAHLEVADRRQGRHHADTTNRGPDRAHGFSFVPVLHAGTADEPRAARHAPGTDRGSFTFSSPEGLHQCRARCSTNRR